ncbi:MAG TPA: hypothetical protein VLZ89_18575 [Anaerolineales bacterium]|nr:hypothetical protein [Anaerolineales bacterium]
MAKGRWVLFTSTLLILGCSLTAAPRPVTPTVAPSIAATPTSGPSLPPVTGPEPSYRAAAFYYPWYGNPKIDGKWIHWEEPDFHPPQDISSDYYPALGAYSSRDPAVVAQHMAWLRQAGIGVIITSWWGQGTPEDDTVPLLLRMAEQYGIKVAFHIEPYSARTASGLVRDIKYLYQQYGTSPAFFRSTATTHYSPAKQPKGMFFVWCIEFVGECGRQPAQADYWQAAMDEIHALPEGALVIANTQQGSWIDGGHFDGLYNYVSNNLAGGSDFGWAAGLPPDSLYIPSVAPGFSGRRIADPADTYAPRNDGAKYDEQWKAALGTGLQPELVTITSFNEWHEGTMIEPPAPGATNGQGYTYSDFGSLPPDGYLTLTHEWIGKYLQMTWPASYRARIQITTTSDWTTVAAISGGRWTRPEMVAASQTAAQSTLDDQGRFALLQPLADANAGKSVEMTWDVSLAGLDPGGTLILEIDRGDLGSTQLTIYNYVGNSPVPVKTFRWSGITRGRNPDHVVIPASLLLNGPNP